MRKFLNFLWMFFSIGALLALLAAPIANVFSSQGSSYALTAAVGNLSVLVLMSIITLWIEGSKANPALLAGIFLGITIGGVVVFALEGETSLIVVLLSVGGAGLLLTGLMVDAFREKKALAH